MRTRSEIEKEIAEQEEKLKQLRTELDKRPVIDEGIIQELVLGTHGWPNRAQLTFDQIYSMVEWYIKRKRSKKAIIDLAALSKLEK